ncbi:hypothetical protein Pmani_037570 [Petrolisthes manimaculis]|uniref:Uncharacterized protein n=1 Tax=Petrolisthes manimaculis TaxID=1843537 RepID=A0AAE1TLA3_9EUCA|nr:hypothetical protein Pmani_037570 [Petrolisthes manimaculis]
MNSKQTLNDNENNNGLAEIMRTSEMETLTRRLQSIHQSFSIHSTSTMTSILSILVLHSFSLSHSALHIQIELHHTTTILSFTTSSSLHIQIELHHTTTILSFTSSSSLHIQIELHHTTTTTILSFTSSKHHPNLRIHSPQTYPPPSPLPTPTLLPPAITTITVS